MRPQQHDELMRRPIRRPRMLPWWLKLALLALGIAIGYFVVPFINDAPILCP